MDLIRLILILQVIRWTCKGNVKEQNIKFIPPPSDWVEKFAKNGASWNELVENYMKRDFYKETCSPHCGPNEFCKHGICVCKCGYVGPRCRYFSPESGYSLQVKFSLGNVMDYPLTLPNDTVVEIIDHILTGFQKMAEPTLSFFISGYVPSSFRIVNTVIE